MTLFKLTWRLMWAQRWVSAATILALLLPTALAVMLLVTRFQTEGALKKGAGQFDLIIGAKGGAMQLVLSSLYHLGMPAGNILYTDYEALKNDQRVRAAIPIGLGDNYAGYRIVGTEPTLFSLQDHMGNPITVMAEGRAFTQNTFEAVIGAQVAHQAGLKLGDYFHGTHGLLKVAGSEVHTDFTYEVVGILAPTGSAHDRAIYTPISAVWKVHHAEKSVHQVFKNPQPIKQEVTAVLVQLESAGLRLWMLDELKKKPNLMAAIPINEILSLSQLYLAPFQKLLFLITVGVIIVSCLVILLSLYQAVERRETSLMTLRSLGASRGELLRMLFYEVAVLILMGLLSGWLVGHVIVSILSGYVYDKTGLILKAWEIVPGEFTVIGVIATVLFSVGLFPLIYLYRRSVIQ